MKASLFLGLSITASVKALDITLGSFTCDTELPFYAVGLQMSCSDGESERCSFGETATFSGELRYNGTDAAGVSEDGIVYGKAGLQLMTLDYDMFNGSPLYMCGPWVAAVEENDAEAYESTNWNGYRRLADAGDDAAAAGDDAVAEGDDAAAAAEEDNAAQGCAQDGLYTFFVDLDLPESDGQISWLASGWKGVGNIMLFSTKGDASSLVGYCTLDFATYVTPDESKVILGYNYVPSALVAVIVIGGFVASILLMCCFCGSGKKKESTRKAKTKSREVVVKATPKASVETIKPKVERTPDDRQFDPIEMARSTSHNNDDYQCMEDRHTKGEIA